MKAFPTMLAAALTATLVTGMPAVTQASDTPVQKVTITTLQHGPKDGAAQLVSTITWDSAKKATIKGTIDDLCPGDGYGAYVTFRAVTFGQPGHNASDTKTCKAKATAFSFALVPVLPTSDIAKIKVTVCERDTDSMLPRSKDCMTNTYANPLA